ncbi:hypothetical protein AAFF_G00301370 [Aldrovandia affinis]|uniref:Uncharacterized protein n=1 Tax=Aldrovandia affinis TaxID=143900 RepID=A0AAD7SQT1_9TELE|nr:hypothetical protein AAFF_G00301370 [Aldrovandia affinis]
MCPQQQCRMALTHLPTPNTPPQSDRRSGPPPVLATRSAHLCVLTTVSHDRSPIYRGSLPCTACFIIKGALVQVRLEPRERARSQWGCPWSCALRSLRQVGVLSGDAGGTAPNADVKKKE